MSAMEACNTSPATDVEVEVVPHLIYMYITPITCVLGGLAAVLCVIVFSKRQMRSSLNVYLAGLSSFDFLLLLMSFIIYLPMQMCVEDGRRGTFTCHLFWKSTLFTYPISLIAQTGSVWTCVAVTVDRFLAVRYPLHSKIWCTPKRALILLCTITALSVLYRLPSIFELSLNECGELAATPMRNEMWYIRVYITYGYILLMIIFPWTVMIILNTFVVMAVHKAYKIRRSLQGSKNQEEKDRRCTIMAIVMVVTFIVFNSIAAGNNIIEAFNLPFAYHNQRIPLGNLLVCLNSASNIIIYSLFGARFRQMCVVMLCGKKSRWMVWLKVTRGLVSDFDPKEGFTRKTSLEQSTALLSAKTSIHGRSSQRWSRSSRSSFRGVDRMVQRDSIAFSPCTTRLSEQL